MRSYCSAQPWPTLRTESKNPTLVTRQVLSYWMLETIYPSRIWAAWGTASWKLAKVSSDWWNWPTPETNELGQKKKKNIGLLWKQKKNIQMSCKYRKCNIISCWQFYLFLFKYSLSFFSVIIINVYVCDGLVNTNMCHFIF